jgi:hypothetical protein
MDKLSGWILLAASLLLDAVLERFPGRSIPIVHRLLIAGAVQMTVCALVGHACKWLRTLLVEFSKLVECFSATLQCVATQVACVLLLCIHLSDVLRRGLRNPENIPDQPCPGGDARRNGSRATFREHCGRRR